MLRGGILVLFLVCPLWVYLRGNMDPVQLHTALAAEHCASGVGLNQLFSRGFLVGPANLPCKQDTTKAFSANQNGICLQPDHDVAIAPWWVKFERENQAFPLEDCAEHVRRLQERLDFLEMYVFELLPRPTQQKLDALPRPTLTEEDVKYMLELVRKTPLTKIPEGK